MSIVQWSNNDFQVFQVDGLEQRMEALTTIIRPKFQELGEIFSGYFSTQTGE